MPQPVSLEWSPDKTATKWNEIKYRLDNLPGGTTGRYTWEIPDENLWKFWVRARAVDKASNTGESIWAQEVIVDLEQPSVGNVKIRGGNTPPGMQQPKNTGGSDTPPSVPVVPTPLPPPPSPQNSCHTPSVPGNSTFHCRLHSSRQCSFLFFIPNFQTGLSPSQQSLQHINKTP